MTIPNRTIQAKPSSIMDYYYEIMIERYCTGIFILMSKTMATKYMPIIWDRKRTKKLELFGLEIHMKNFDIVNKRPLVEQTTMVPTKPNDIC